MLYAVPERIRAEVETALASYGHGSGHVFNLGHGIHTDTNPDHVLALVEAARGAIKRYHQKPQGKRAHPNQALISAARKPLSAAPYEAAGVVRRWMEVLPP